MLSLWSSHTWLMLFITLASAFTFLFLLGGEGPGSSFNCLMGFLPSLLVGYENLAGFYDLPGFYDLSDFFLRNAFVLEGVEDHIFGTF